MSSLRSALDELAAEDLDGTTGEQLGADLVDLFTDLEVLHSQILRRLVRFANLRSFEDEGYLSAVSWLIDKCGLGPGRARDFLGMAQNLVHMPKTAEAFAAGRLDVQKVRQLTTVRRAYPSEFAEHEEVLVEAAVDLPPHHLRRIIDHWRQNLDHAAALDDANRLHERRHLHISSTFGGMVRIDGELDREGGETVMTAIHSLTDPAGRAADDNRTPAQCRADALVDICRDHLDSGDAPASGGEKPHISVLVELETLEQRAGKTCELENGGVIHPEAARRLACDAAVTRIITDGPSQVLDVGRRTRTVPAAVRRALIVRDRGCVVKGCGRPPRWCDAHHIKHWIDGGITALVNLVLLCRRHHRLVHEGKIVLEVPP